MTDHNICCCDDRNWWRNYAALAKFARPASLPPLRVVVPVPRPLLIPAQRQAPPGVPATRPRTRR